MRYRPNKQNRPDRPGRLNRAKWTFMVYMAADNSLDRAALRDIAEMAAVGSSNKVKIVVQLDRAVDQRTRRFLITKGGGYRKDYIEVLGETDTGDPKVLEDFVTWAIHEYPARRYCLVLWDHGGGWWEDPRRSIAYDDSSDGDALDNGELKTALSSITKKLGRPIDILGMDACLMSMLEVAYQLKDHVRVMVSSEEEEPWDGWPYHRILQAIKNRPGSWPGTIGKRMVKEYVKSYRGKGQNVTQAAFDLCKCDDLVTRLDTLSGELISSLGDADLIDAVNKAGKASPKFFSREYIDLSGFCRELSKRSPNKAVRYLAKDIVKALEPGRRNVILCQRHLGRKMRHVHGMSIYFPPKGVYINPRYRRLDFYKACRWGKFLEIMNDEL